MLKERFLSIVDQSKKRKGMIIRIILVAMILYSGMSIAIGSKTAPVSSIETDGIKTAVLDLKGYSIEGRPDWQFVSAGDSDTYKLVLKGQDIGGIKLIREEVGEPNAANIFNLDLADERISAVVLQEDGYFKVIHSIDKAVIYEQYTFTSLPNPPPYAYAIYFDRRYVSEEEVEAVLASFTMPEYDYNSPKKIREALQIEEAQKSAVCQIAREDGREEVVNLALLDQFINKMALGRDAYVEIVRYIEQDGTFTIKDWYALSFSDNMGRCYGYYPLENGQYTYDDMPVTFKEITKKEYENVIAYRLDGEMRLLQIKTPVEVVTLTAQENGL